MRLQKLFEALSALTQKERETFNLHIFDYAKGEVGEWIDLPNLSVCIEGEPAWHLTIN